MREKKSKAYEEIRASTLASTLSEFIRKGKSDIGVAGDIERALERESVEIKKKSIVEGIDKKGIVNTPTFLEVQAASTGTPPKQGQRTELVGTDLLTQALNKDYFETAKVLLKHGAVVSPKVFEAFSDRLEKISLEKMEEKRQAIKQLGNSDIESTEAEVKSTEVEVKSTEVEVKSTGVGALEHMRSLLALGDYIRKRTEEPETIVKGALRFFGFFAKDSMSDDNVKGIKLELAEGLLQALCSAPPAKPSEAPPIADLEEPLITWARKLLEKDVNVGNEGEATTKYIKYLQDGRLHEVFKEMFPTVSIKDIHQVFSTAQAGIESDLQSSRTEWHVK